MKAKKKKKLYKFHSFVNFNTILLVNYTHFSMIEVNSLMDKNLLFLISFET